MQNENIPISMIGLIKYNKPILGAGFIEDLIFSLLYLF
jgi:hypothetical protein